MMEDKIAETAYFITLTYDNDHVPITKKRFMTLDKKHVQDFMKRLRYYSPPLPKIKYYAAGEYGSDTMRPHYHIIIFNAHPVNIDKAWCDKKGNPIGTIFYGTVSEASVGYSLKYISKKGKIPIHSNDDRLPEFSLSSTKLGANYLTPQMRQWHEADIYNRMYIALKDGKKISMCRYFKDKIYTKEQREHIGAYQATRIKEQQEKERQEYGPNYERDKAEAYAQAQRKKGLQANKNNKI